MSEYRRMLACIAGEKAARAGKPRPSCNRERGTIFYDDWMDGYDHGERAREREENQNA